MAGSILLLENQLRDLLHDPEPVIQIIRNYAMGSNYYSVLQYVCTRPYMINSIMQYVKSTGASYYEPIDLFAHVTTSCAKCVGLTHPSQPQMQQQPVPHNIHKQNPPLVQDIADFKLYTYLKQHYPPGWVIQYLNYIVQNEINKIIHDCILSEEDYLALSCPPLLHTKDTFNKLFNELMINIVGLFRILFVQNIKIYLDNTNNHHQSEVISIIYRTCASSLLERLILFDYGRGLTYDAKIMYKLPHHLFAILDLKAVKTVVRKMPLHLKRTQNYINNCCVQWMSQTIQHINQHRVEKEGERMYNEWTQILQSFYPTRGFSYSSSSLARFPNQPL